mmetsp:Transcript_3880/g.5130  ORF Transcript_3880/g.5130 Transcript_3880/m.5130 type:complete len:100 (+) Transcript_3880:96-395(+)
MTSMVRLALLLLTLQASLVWSQTLYGGRTHYPKSKTEIMDEDIEEVVSFQEKIRSIMGLQPLKVIAPIAFGSFLAIALQLILVRLENSGNKKDKKEKES